MLISTCNEKKFYDDNGKIKDAYVRTYNLISRCLIRHVEMTIVSVLVIFRTYYEHIIETNVNVLSISF